MTIALTRTLAILASGLTLAAWTTATDSLKLTPESRLWVDGNSSVKSFSCKAPVLESAIATEGGDPVAAALAGTNAITTVNVTVPIEKMDCGNGTMNDHMRKALKAKEFPTIVFQLQTYALAKGDTSTAGTLNGTLTIGGIAKPIVLPVVLQGAPEGVLRVTGNYELNMRDYELKPPSLMLGTMKVREKVKVGFDLLLKR